MNKLGHQSQATALLPTIILGSAFLQTTQYNNEVSANIAIFMNSFLSTNLIIVAVSVLAYFIGSVAMDWIDFNILKHLASNKEDHTTFHRQITHGFFPNLALLALSIYSIEYFNNAWAYVGVFFMIGVWTHLIMDMLTGSIPWFFYSDYRSNWGRVGINRIMPKILRPIFNEFLPTIADKKITVLGMYAVGIYSFVLFGGLETLTRLLG